MEGRRLVADLMRILTKDLSEREALQHRITLTNALIDLGRFVKVPSEKPKGNRDGCYHSQIDINRAFPARSRSVSYSRTEGLPISLTNKHCIFCVFRPHHQCYFFTSRKAREHFEKHMRGFERDGPIWCPDEFCQLVLHGHQSLKEHAD